MLENIRARAPLRGVLRESGRPLIRPCHNYSEGCIWRQSGRNNFIFVQQHHIPSNNRSPKLSIELSIFSYLTNLMKFRYKDSAVGFAVLENGYPESFMPFGP